MFSKINLTVFSENFTIERKLGGGASADVYLVKEIQTQETYALKIYNNHGPGSMENLNIVSNLEHPGILQTIAKRHRCPINLIGDLRVSDIALFEYCPGGDVMDSLLNYGPFDDRFARFYFCQLLITLQYLHTQGIAHLDIKPENLLFDDNFDIRIGDFDFAEKLSPTGMTRFVGTNAYLTPEQLLQNPFNGVSADLFAAGVTLFCMRVHAPPFKEASSTDFRYRNLHRQPETFWKQFIAAKYPLSDDFKDFITKLLAPEPEDRLTYDQIEAHPWFNGEIPTREEIATEMNRRRSVDA